VTARIAVVLLNLGGPQSVEAVQPFLESLFGDPAIIALPALLRRPLAFALASARRTTAARNYALMGGASPLLAETRAQATALEAILVRLLAPAQVRTFVAMRHAPPTSDETAAEVAAYGPDQVVLAPLYPQFSTTTTASSLKAWREAYVGSGLSRAVCCWYDEPSLIEAHANLILDTWRAAGSPRVRLLFSAHGLPRTVVDKGDPYQWQVEATCARLAERLGGGWDWRVCYQSRVGPMKWLEPSTPQAIRQAAVDGLGVIIDPIAFVSEHVETLVELDHDYRRLALAVGAAPFLRVPALGTTTAFIAGLARIVEAALERSGDAPNGAACPARFARCGRAGRGEASC
jgi:ferrochelatase